MNTNNLNYTELQKRKFKKEFSETSITNAIYADIPITLVGKIITGIKIFLNN
tara:strand:+ start:43 stop:198 length:156 start_codon:yes stop_codon:yes gene_type:complete